MREAYLGRGDKPIVHEHLPVEESSPRENFRALALGFLRQRFARWMSVGGYRIQTKNKKETRGSRKRPATSDVQGRYNLADSLLATRVGCVNMGTETDATREK